MTLKNNFQATHFFGVVFFALWTPYAMAAKPSDKKINCIPALLKASNSRKDSPSRLISDLHDRPTGMSKATDLWLGLRKLSQKNQDLNFSIRGVQDTEELFNRLSKDIEKLKLTNRNKKYRLGVQKIIEELDTIKQQDYPYERSILAFLRATMLLGYENDPSPQYGGPFDNQIIDFYRKRIEEDAKSGGYFLLTYRDPKARKQLNERDFVINHHVPLYWLEYNPVPVDVYDPWTFVSHDLDAHASVQQRNYKEQLQKSGLSVDAFMQKRIKKLTPVIEAFDSLPAKKTKSFEDYIWDYNHESFGAQPESNELQKLYRRILEESSP